MEKLNLIKEIMEATGHTIGSIAEILNVDAEELSFPEEVHGYDEINHYKIQLLVDFLDNYSISFHASTL